MVKEKYIINIGQIDKYIIFILLGGASQCICSIMLYVFKDIANYNQHTFIIGFNASIGMSFSFIPFIIEKIIIDKVKKNKKGFLESVPSLKGSYLEEEEKKLVKQRKQKYIILLICAFLDFAQKSLSYILNKYIINNIWIFNICFISIIEFIIMKRKLYKHQYFSSIIITILGIIATIIGTLEEENVWTKLLLCLTIEILYSFEIVLAKLLMDYKEASPFEITFYEGIFSLFLNTILLIIFTNYPLPDDDKYDKIFRLTNYEGKKYLDNFYAAFGNMGVGEGFLFLLSACGRLFSSICGHIVIKHYTSSHVVLILILGEIGLVFKENSDWPNVAQFILFCFVLIMLLIFTEIIEINACDLEKNTRKNIYLRQLYEINNPENKDILAEQEDEENQKIELIGNFDVIIEGDRNNSFNMES